MVVEFYTGSLQSENEEVLVIICEHGERALSGNLMSANTLLFQ